MFNEERENILIERLVRRQEKANEQILKELGKILGEIGQLTPSEAYTIGQQLKYGESLQKIIKILSQTSQDGTTYITCSSASDSNEIIVFSGDIKVTSVGNSLNTSLLSSNLQEETNIDDIQEEPTLDDVNETEDIEQNEEPIEEEVS